jgi:hypothetical protein
MEANNSGLPFNDAMRLRKGKMGQELKTWFAGGERPQSLAQYFSMATAHGEEAHQLAMRNLPEDPELREKAKRILAGGVAHLLDQAPKDNRTNDFYLNTLQLASQLQYPEILHAPLERVTIPKGPLYFANQPLLDQARQRNSPKTSE